MTAQHLDGRATSAAILVELRSRVESFVREQRRSPVLATILVGSDPASQTYVKMKVDRCHRIGITPRRVDLDASASPDELLRVVEALSAEPDVDGILLQHPVPDQIDERAAFEAIDPAKDVDGVTGASFASMAFSGKGFAGATPGGIMALLDAYNIALAGRYAVVVGRSAILGKPIGMLLLGRDATVTYCHSRTVDLSGHVSRADIVVAAVGVPGLIKGEWIKPGAVVVDAGYADNRGDVEFEAAAERASFITPVPGGVGPMTIATLLAQTVRAAEQRCRPR